MTDTQDTSLSGRLAARFGDTLSISVERNETTAEQTLKALFGGDATRSAAETQVIGKADGDRADPGIRSSVGSPDTQVVDKGLVTRDIVFAPEGDGRDAQAAIPGA